MEGLNLLFLNICDNVIDANLADNLLVDESRPHGQVLLLNLEKVSALHTCCDQQVEEFRIFDATAVKVLVVQDDPHLVLA